MLEGIGQAGYLVKSLTDPDISGESLDCSCTVPALVRNAKLGGWARLSSYLASAAEISLGLHGGDPLGWDSVVAATFDKSSH